MSNFTRTLQITGSTLAVMFSLQPSTRAFDGDMPISDKIASASPWRLWNSKQVTLRGLSPNAAHYYKAVVVTGLGTTTSAQASFKAIAR